MKQTSARSAPQPPNNLPNLLKGIDLALTLRDVFMTGNMLALGGLVDFIPPSFFRAAGRFLSRLPGTNTIRHLGNDMGAWVDDLARRFGRGAEGRLRYILGSANLSPVDEIDSNLTLMSSATNRRVSSQINADNRLVSAAQESTKNESVQRAVDRLKENIITGKTTDEKVLFNNVYEARHVDSGARVYFMREANGDIVILAVSNKSNQTKVISILQELYGK